LEVGIIGHNFGRGPSKDHTTKVWLQLAQWFLRLPTKMAAKLKIEKRGDEIKRKSSPLKLLNQSQPNLAEFPIGSYVKLSSAVGAILVEGPNRRTYFWKRTIQ
jgi:hypothetical protein